MMSLSDQQHNPGHERIQSFMRRLISGGECSPKGAVGSKRNGRRTGDFSRLNHSKTAVAADILLDRFEELRFAEIRPERGGDNEFGIGYLPEEKIADSHFAAGSDQ